MHETESRIDVLLAKSLSRETNREEMAELHELLSAEGEGLQRISGQAWDSADASPFLPSSDVARAWAKIKPEKVKNNSDRLYWLSGIAASLILISMITFFLINQTDHSMYAMLNQISARPGETKEIVLPDSSKVVLNSGSTLQYPARFEGPFREVYLEGEAFFEVTRNNRRPFKVHVGDLDVRVYSTSFNVRAYKGMPQVSVAVRSGKVSFARQGKEAEGVLLSPFQKGIFTYAGSRFSTGIVAEGDFAWMEQKLVFDNTALEDVVAELKRRYGIEVSLINKDLANCRISATFHRQSAEEVLNAIALMLNLETGKDGDRLFLKGNGCQLN